MDMYLEEQDQKGHLPSKTHSQNTSKNSQQILNVLRPTPFCLYINLTLRVDIITWKEGYYGIQYGFLCIIFNIEFYFVFMTILYITIFRNC